MKWLNEKTNDKLNTFTIITNLISQRCLNIPIRTQKLLNISVKIRIIHASFQL